MASFVEKDREPKLSDSMKNLLNNTHLKKGVPTDKYDNIDMYKFLIMRELLNDQDILRTLHYEKLESNTREVTLKDKFGNNILDSSGNPIKTTEIIGTGYQDKAIFNFLKIPDIQSEVKNYICFEVNDMEIPRGSTVLMTKNIIFRTIAHESDYKTDWGIARQDLLAAIIKNKFDWTNIFGNHLELCSDRGKVADLGFYYREFIYETTTVNNLVNKAQNGGKSYEQYKNPRRS